MSKQIKVTLSDDEILFLESLHPTKSTAISILIDRFNQSALFGLNLSQDSLEKSHIDQEPPGADDIFSTMEHSFNQIDGANNG